ncbi:MAG: choice-of-anchor L domain-containing protein [Hyphomicrobiales bacterium]
MDKNNPKTKSGYAIIFTLFLLTIAGYGNLKAQNFSVVECKSNADVIKVIDTVLLKDLRKQGLVKNIKFKGAPRAVGYFTNGDFIDVNRGVVMTTGLATNAKGPNTQPARTGINEAGSDADLESLAGNLKSYDACIVEFDFTPMTNKVTFQYVFGSEEYNQYVNKGFNDVFGFFVSGPGITGPYTGSSTNIALVPNTNDPVSINTINCGQEDDYRTPPPGNGKNCDYYHWNDKFPGTPDADKAIEYNGYTVVLTAEATVQPCKEYHMKLAISDIGDPALDSGVFLKAESFDIGDGAYELDFTHESVGNVILPGCNEGFLKISVPDIQAEQTIGITYSGDAIIGTDVAGPLPDHVILKPGDFEKTIKITGINNNIKGQKLLIANIESIYCEGAAARVDTFFVKPYNPVKITNEDYIEVACEDQVKIKAKYKDGYPEYKFEWNDKAGKDNITLPVTKDPIKLKVTDVCTSDTKEIQLIATDLTVDFKLDKDDVCLGDEIVVEYTGSSYGSNATVKWDFGGGTFNKIATNKYRGTFNTAGEKTISLEIDDPDCGNGKMEKKVIVNETPNINFDATNIQGCSPVKVALSNTESNSSAVKYEWNIPGIGKYEGNDLNLDVSKAGTYDVTLKASAGQCSKELTHKKQITVYPMPETKILPSKNVFPANGTIVEFTSSLKESGLTYNWEVDSIETSNNESIFIGSEEPVKKQIILTVKNSDGCSFKASKLARFVIDKLFVPNALSINTGGQNKKLNIISDGIMEAKVYIFNRWGQEVFHTNDINNFWDGRFKNKYVSPGAYAIRIVYKTYEDEKKTYSGLIYVVK